MARRDVVSMGGGQDSMWRLRSRVRAAVVVRTSLVRSPCAGSPLLKVLDDWHEFFECTGGSMFSCSCLGELELFLRCYSFAR